MRADGCHVDCFTKTWPWFFFDFLFLAEFISIKQSAALDIVSSSGALNKGAYTIYETAYIINAGHRPQKAATLFLPFCVSRFSLKREHL
jgi:hypothetical protein